MSKHLRQYFITVIFLGLVIILYPQKVISKDRNIHFSSVAIEIKEPDNYKMVPTEVIKKYAKMKLTPQEFRSLDYIISRESGWCYTKWNGQNDCPVTPRTVRIPNHSGAYGLCQTMLNMHKVDKATFMTDPYQQVDWCIAYGVKRYGSLQQAQAIWEKQKWW